ncbi:MAG: M81 family metallopeptidase [Rhodospirillaceae bacterium]|jgi:microcystin degradation protein MlrC|nr:M81 family metallopeptidase [Rhodospirillaceae bacterium]
MRTPPRVLTGLFGHETNTFSQLPTTLAHFEDYLLAFGDDIPATVEGSVIEPAGVEDAAAELGWELLRSVVAWTTPSGRVARDAWDACAGHALETAAKAGQLDGVLFSMHGAMATVDHDDAEGEFLEQLRGVIGPDVPVAITLDLHANVTERMARHADIICAYRTYPHIDQAPTAKRAAKILDMAMKGEVRPVSHIARRDLLGGLDSGRTTVDNPMTELLARADKLEATDDGVLLVSVQAGFCPADLDEAGPTVVVCGDGHDTRFQAIAEDFMDHAWETRHYDSNEYLDVAGAMQRLVELPASDGPTGGPVVLADASDNPGSGAYGDSTFLLNGMIKAGLENAAFGTICDPDAAAHLVAAGEGATATLSLGGKVDATYGPPIDVTGTVVTVTDGSYLALGPRWGGTIQHLGATAVLRVGGIDVIVASKRLQCTELETFTHAGIDPREKDVVAVKSIHHFRAAYEPIARQVLIIDSGALATKDFGKLPYKNLRRPIFPLDLD